MPAPTRSFSSRQMSNGARREVRVKEPGLRI